MIRKNISLLLPLLVVFAAAAVAGETSQFSGTWEGRFQGTLYCTLKISAGESWSGTLAAGNIHTNEDGELTEVSEVGDGAALRNFKQEDGRLTFEWEPDSDGPVGMALEITADGRALLHFINVPGGVNIKPLKLQRAD